MAEDKNGQLSLGGIEEWWEEHWKEMPEYQQKDLMPWKSVIVHFENEADMAKFAELIEQEMSVKTISVWYPAAERATPSKYRYTTIMYKDKRRPESERDKR